MLHYFLRASGWVCLIPLAIGGGMLIAAQVAAVDAERLEADGIADIATVTDKRIDTRTRYRDGQQRTSRSHVLSYQFEVPGGDPHSAEEVVSSSRYNRTVIGQQIPVRFVPAEPEINEIDQGEAARAATLFTLIGGAIVALGLGIALWSARKAARMQRIAVSGVRATATVDKVIRRKGHGRLHFRYQDTQGTWHEGRCLGGRSQRYHGLSEGDRIDVRYDRGHPKRAYWERDLAMR